jgi:hypothetical protein
MILREAMGSGNQLEELVCSASDSDNDEDASCIENHEIGKELFEKHAE